MRPLDRDDITGLLAELAAELHDHGQEAEILLVGGAAMALAYDARRATRDLDAVFAPTEVVRRAAAAVAERRGMSADWLNDAVKGFMPAGEPESDVYFEAPGLRVTVASPRYLLAMKLLAARVEYDADDIALLYRMLGFDTVEQGLDLVARSYPHRPIPPKTQYLLAEIVESLRHDTDAID